MIIKKDPDIIRAYFEDTSNLDGGHADAVMIPETAAELADLVREANARHTPLTIAGGGTGTTGSRIPFGGVVLSLERLRRIDPPSGSAMSCRAEAAASVDDLKAACEARALFYASHPTERSATIGGTVATNASGARSFKYGPTRWQVKALSMVLPTGEPVTMRRGEGILSAADPVIRLPGIRPITIPWPSYVMPRVKNAAGYYCADGMDAIDLFIGQEGTLSIITAVEIALTKRPERILSAFVFFSDEPAAWAFAGEARRLSRAPQPSGAGAIDALSLEYLDRNALDLVRAKYSRVPGNARAAIFFEQETSPATEDEVVAGWSGLIAKHGASEDGTWVAMTEEESERFNVFRHAIPESINEIVRRNGFQKLSTDIAVPDVAIDEMMRYYTETLDRSGMEHVVFGHIGECHIHANVLPRSAAESRRGQEIVTDFIRKGIACAGTVSAEHGIGKIKRPYLEMMYGREGIRDMARIKKALDPRCLLGLDTLFARDLLYGA